MLEDSEDPVVKTVQPTIKTGRKWKVVEAVDDAKECLKIKEVIGQTQIDCKRLGSTVTKRWSKQEGKKRRDTVINEIRMNEDSRRVQKAVQQPQQGQWTNWDNALQKSLTWNNTWHMAPLRISFLIRSMYDLLPSNENLVRWGKKEDPTCPLCNGRQITEHVLSSCKVARSKGRYTWRHNRPLQELAVAISMAKGQSTQPQADAVIFTTEGGAISWHGMAVKSTNQRKRLLDGCDDLEVSADLPEWDSHPSIIKETRLRPDIVINLSSTQQIILVELTVPYESRMEEAHTYKREKYLNLTKELRDAAYKAVVMPVEVGARGFIRSSVYDLLTKLAICGNKRTKALKLPAEMAEKSSRWIWSRRKERSLHND